ncbi:bifunctional adenosylcobinamide kinase/adenosylcobinamide-phosphate guanylyltransferase [Meiothermus granaticius]|uniref:Adenosylcobinamide kinase n=1 Tax=Meiothermus granaticius NBRC 107808 TaxID=1227551 RepID=A0A399F815_9DEIN|nr:bifunctional adenosylcobinamide kinase/adenosylcobinamide-phosphate guanylyltransferase [Meiothermus granaticius]RIH91399.1 Bifunctional adenosylcobalamin biosynthesis protein CobP [Meiothermus granaticius NBRC 107808]GEM87070.1 adenosylcobinamide kinase/adenosylcobinamide phosphate guanyltransferase [Meiothermus granaticius NBRC 107808]
MPGLIFVTGGARAGKSTFAQQQAQALGGEEVSFIATAQGLDAEMRERIARHRQERPAQWETLEEPLQVPAALHRARYRVVLLDCLTLWVANLMQAQQEVLPRVEGLLAAWAETDKTLVVVSNEVGMGIVPENALARAYRDQLGAVNRRVAEAAEAVYLLVAGIPLKLR